MAGEDTDCGTAPKRTRTQADLLTVKQGTEEANLAKFPWQQGAAASTQRPSTEFHCTAGNRKDTSALAMDGKT
jgi:hypothetical protein